MTVRDKQLTWERFVAAIKVEFTALLNTSTPDCWYEFRFNEDCPTACDSLDYFYPMALVQCCIEKRAWWNLWRGTRYAKTLFEIHEDWGGAFRTRVSASWADRVLPVLEKVEKAIGVTFKIATG